MDEHRDIKKVDITATLACLTALLFWSLGSIFIKYLTGYVDAWTQNFLRYLTACLFWLPFLIFSIYKNKFDKRIWGKAVGPSAANLTMQTTMTLSFYYIDPAFMVLLMKSYIVWTALFSLLFFFDEKPLTKSKHFWLGMIFSVIGVVGVIYFKADFTAERTMIGIVLALVTGFMFAVYTISAKIVFKEIDSRQGFSVISIYTVSGLAVLALLFGDIEKSLQMGAWQWSCIIISAITAIALGHVLYYSAMKRIGATIPALLILAQPFIVLAFSYVIFGESLNLFQFLSGVILIIGSALAIWAQQHLKHPE